ncbi:MAG: alpha/beta hydrolase [Planctomycetaceae bacterium]|nr:alpha/beta hydrolase [Planctomycetaceae bacterium]
MNWVLLAIAAIVIADLAVRIFYVRLILPQFDAKPPFNVQRHPVDSLAEPAALITRDGVLLRGAVHRAVDQPARGVVLFFPELDGDHWSAANYCEGLLAAGFDVASFDFRGQGESDTPIGYTPNHWPTQHELVDAASALQWVSEQPEWRDLPLGVFGISRGSVVGLVASADCPQVQAYCGEGTYTVDRLLEHFALRWAQLYLPLWAFPYLPLWHLRVTLRLARWTSEWRRHVRYAIVEKRFAALRRLPVLLIAGERDTYVNPTVTKSIVDAIGGRQSTLWEVPGAKHNQAREAVGAQYDARLVEFFSRMCPASVGTEEAVLVAVK